MGEGYGVLSGTMSNGQKFYTSIALSEMAAGAANDVSDATLVSAGLTLQAAVDAALGAATGSVPGTMASGTVATLRTANNAAIASGL